MKRKLSLVRGILVVMSIVLIPYLLWAEEGRRPPRGERPPKGLPQELIEACQDKNVGDSCECVMPDGNTDTGTCQPSPEDDSQLACRPDNPPERPKPKD